jgi:hypothetical protein
MGVLYLIASRYMQQSVGVRLGGIIHGYLGMGFSDGSGYANEKELRLAVV